jgi:hypothetical protein
MIKSLRGLLQALVLSIGSSAFGAPQLMLVPNPAKIHPNPEESFTIDVRISGLNDGTTRTLVGAFDLSLSYGPVALDANNVPTVQFLPTLSAAGPSLGSVSANEAVVTLEHTFNSGLIHLAEVSLLEGDRATCVFCVGPFLEDLQSDEFSLGVLLFNAFAPAKGFGSLSVAVTDATVGNAAGDAIDVALPAAARIQIPIPSTVALLCLGLPALSLARRRSCDKSYSPAHKFS